MNHIQYASQEDAEEIMSVMMSGLASAKNKDWYVADDLEFVKRHIAKEGYTLKYVEHGEIAGFLIVRHPGMGKDNLGSYLEDISEEEFYKVTHMESAAVLPKYQGQGIQHKLMARAEEIERERGTVYLMGTVHPDNIYSRGNLEKLGYDCLLTTEKYGGLMRNIMCKRI